MSTYLRRYAEFRVKISDFLRVVFTCKFYHLKIPCVCIRDIPVGSKKKDSEEFSGKTKKKQLPWSFR